MTSDSSLVNVNTHPATLKMRWIAAHSVHDLVASGVRAGVEGRKQSGTTDQSPTLVDVEVAYGLPVPHTLVHSRRWAA